ncbi:tRNA 2'-phosphotransferase [Conoideocrella luteorostrata]|uniref:2'-phosphotransferase n=1 Tax=Conoideocrella luteorostrata TaxID=1105319 RepID=A0AAJ0CM30_9HYPO|nr:tRNA 2'-phosphotransferase [Conoideocrella luteorostrata]
MADEAPAAHLDIEDKAHGMANSGRRGGRRGRGEGRDVRVSKALSKLLRHQAENAGIKLDGEGFAPLDKVLRYGPLESLRVSLEEVKTIVETNSKQRFTLKPNPANSPSLSGDPPSAADYLIRANQGHSLEVDSAALFTPILPDDTDFPEKVIHGTYFAFWSAILESGGLKPMNRGHIHCSDKTPEGGAVSGMRRDAELLVEIDVGRSIREGGVTWWRSQNGVILTDGGEAGVLETRFFKKVTSRTVDVGVLWEDGEKLADLPRGLKMVVPMGKRGGGDGGGGRGRGRGRGRGMGGRN